MKRYLLFIVASFATMLSIQSFAQTNTFPSSGEVGIGTTSPISKLDVVTGVGDGTTNEVNCLRLRSNTTTSNTMLLHMGVSNVGIGGANQGHGYISTTYWGGSDNNPLILNPKGGPVGIGLANGVAWPATVKGTVAIRSTATTGGNSLMGKLVFAHYGTYEGKSSYIAGVYDKTDFYQGVGMVFHTISGSDISGVDGVERMRISSDGNVGIANTSPSYLLDIGNPGYTADIVNGLRVIGRGTGYTTNHEISKLILSGSSDVSYANFTALAYRDGSTNTSVGGKFQVTNAGSALTAMTITSTGNIGIGTTSPSAQLHTTGSVRFAGLSNDNTFTRVAVTDANGNLAYRDASTLGGSSGWSYDGNTVGVLKKIGTTDNYALPFITNNTEWMRITTSGNIGIGTTSPSEKLSVNGNVRSKKSIVTQTGWADYVFNKDYKLPSLKEVEVFIKQHKHLPEIPSAAEVEKNGVDLGDMSKNLLKKIEELTLYMIDMKKENEELNKKVKKLEKAINKIK